MKRRRTALVAGLVLAGWVVFLVAQETPESQITISMVTPISTAAAGSASCDCDGDVTVTILIEDQVIGTDTQMDGDLNVFDIAIPPGNAGKILTVRVNCAGGHYAEEHFLIT